jgi:hypothetical protein
MKSLPKTSVGLKISKKELKGLKFPEKATRIKRRTERN